MNRKLVLLAALVILVGTLRFAFKVQKVEAGGTIYIRADGSIDPPTANITSTDNVTYTFTDSINDSIVVERDNIVVDGAGYTLQGTGSGYGIYLTGIDNVTIKNVEVTNFGYGIYLSSSTNNNITGNIASSSWAYGIYLSSSTNNTLTGNTASHNDEGADGIYLDSSSNNTLTGNTASYNQYGVHLVSSSKNTLTGNTVSRNSHGGMVIGGSYNNITGNTASHNYGANGIALYSANGNTLTGNTAAHNGAGILVKFSSNNNITGNTASDNRYYGIILSSSSNNNIITGNTASNNWDGEGICLTSSSNNTLTNNTMSGNKYNFGLDGAEGSHFNNTIDDSNTVDDKLIYYLKGVNDTIYNPSSVADAGTLYLIDCTNITIGNLTLTENVNGVFLWNTTNSNIQNVTASNNRFGIYLSSSSNNTLTGNTASNNDYAGISLTSSTNNTLTGNTASNNDYGVYLDSSSNNVLFHNNFVDNTVQSIRIDTTGYVNTWDNGYPSGGNYWSDYAGVDLFSGPHQNVSGCDGIGDTPYVIDADNRDNYPLMEPYPDTKPPTITILSPENKAYATTSIPLTFTIDECTRRIWYSLDGESNVTITGNTTLSGLSEGVHTIVVYANDTIGNKGPSDIVHFTVDTVLPNIDILSPENKTYTTSSVSLDFAVDEATDWIGYSLDGQTNVTITGNTTLTGLFDGAHYVVVYANDTAGNMGTSSTVYFTVDTTPPDITDVSQIPEDNVLPTDEVKINATITDYLSEVTQVILNFTNGNGTWITTDMTPLETNVWNATIPPFEYCTHVNYTIIAEDSVGNTVTTEELEYELQYHVIPEHPSFLILPLFMMATLLAAIVYRKKYPIGK